MDPKSPSPPTHPLTLSADKSSIRECLIGLLHTIFFHRVFTTFQPATHDVLDLTLPYVSDDEIERTIEKRTNAFIRHLETQSSSSSTNGSARGTLVLSFVEKKRKKSTWFVTKADEETVWEIWTIEVAVTTTPRSEPEAARNRRQMEMSLQRAAMRVIDIVNREKSHIPPIMSTETNPFPFQITIGT